MAYISQDLKKQLTPAIKAVLKKYRMKGTLGVKHYSTLVCNLQSGPIQFDEYRQINVYRIKKNYTGVARDFLLELRQAMMVGNHDNSDTMTDYFDVGRYIDINIGQYNKPYILTS